MTRIVSRAAACIAALTLHAAAMARPPDSVLFEPGQPVVMQEGSGILLLLFNNGTEMKAARFSVAGKRSVAFSHSVVPAGPRLFVWQVPAGSYCLERFYSGDYRIEPDPDDMLCFSVKAGHLNYPGSIQFWNFGFGNSARMQLSMQPSVLQSLLAKDRPEYLEPGHRWWFDMAQDDNAALYAQIEADAAAFGVANAFRSAADPDSPKGLLRRADALRIERNVEGYAQRAFELYVKAAEKGEGRAAALACQQLDLGIGIPEDPTRAVGLCRQGVAAGDALAAWQLERLHARSRGGLQPDAEAQAKLKAQFGDEAELGRILVDRSWGIRDGQRNYPDGAEAVRLAQVRMAAGDSGGAFALGYYYANGIGVPVDGMAAVEHYEIAARDGTTLPLRRIAILYWEGKVVPRDLVKTRQYFERSMDIDVSQTNELAWFLATGPDPEHRDGRRAVKLIRDYHKTWRETWARVDTMAAGYAAAGDFEQAVTTQLRAIEMAKKAGATPGSIADCEERLALYRKGQAFVLIP